jgi:hypothetical protein
VRPALTALALAALEDFGSERCRIKPNGTIEPGALG